MASTHNLGEIGFYQENFQLSVDGSRIAVYLQEASAEGGLPGLVSARSEALEILVSQGILYKDLKGAYKPTVLGQTIIDDYCAKERARQKALKEKEEKDRVTITNSRLAVALLRALAGRNIRIEDLENLQVQCLYITTLGCLFMHADKGFLFEGFESSITVKLFNDGKTALNALIVDAALNTLRSRDLASFEDVPEIVQSTVNEIVGYLIPEISIITRRPEYQVIQSQLPGAGVKAVSTSKQVVPLRTLSSFYLGQHSRFVQARSSNPIKSFVEACRG
jgi:hypothetical protein